LPLVQPKEARGPVKALSPMPSFTSQGPGATRIASPVKEATLKTPTTTTQVEKGTRPMIIENTPKHQARIDALVQRQRYGEPDGSPWDGIPSGMRLVVCSDGNERLIRDTVDEGANKSKDIRKTKEVTALLNLGRPETAVNKSGSDDEGLSQALDNMLDGREINPNSKGSVSPLQSLIGDDKQPS
jgi:hypothetical protein